MKKLLAFAVIAAMSFGAYAGCEDTTDPVDCGSVWKVRISARTVSSAAKRYAQSDCLEGFCYRRQGSRTFEGFVYDCTCDCETFQTALGAGTGFLWDRRAKMLWEDLGVETEIMHRIDTRASKVEMVGNMTFGGAAFKVAGFGSFSKDMVTSVRGYFAGTLPAELFFCTSDCEDFIAGYWDMCSSAFEEITEGEAAAAYGNWSMVLDRRLSKVYTEKGETAVLPAFTEGFVPGI